MSDDVDPRISAIMARNRGRDTSPELRVRRLLHGMGLRYRVNFQPIPNMRRTADIAFTRARLLVLVDGCFWHGCSKHYRPAIGTRAAFWAQKIAQTQHRDLESTAAFRAAGWEVLRFWEHEDPLDVAVKIASTLGAVKNPQ